MHVANIHFSVRDAERMMAAYRRRSQAAREDRLNCDPVLPIRRPPSLPTPFARALTYNPEVSSDD